MPTKDAVEVAIGSPRCPALHDAGSRGPRQLFGLWRILRARRPMLPCGLARPRVSRSVAPGPRFPRIIPSLLSRYKGEGATTPATCPRGCTSLDCRRPLRGRYACETKEETDAPNCKTRESESQSG